MEEIAITQTPVNKIYKDRAIYTGTFIGGPLVAGYLIAENFKAFDEPDKARKAWIYSIIATIIIFGGIFLVPHPEKIPRTIIPLIYTAIAYYLVQHYQGTNIKKHVDAGGETFSWWRTLVVGLIGLAITMIGVFGFAYFSDTATSTTTVKNYGLLQNEIQFDKGNISASEIDKIAAGLKASTFFGDQVKKFVYVKKVGNSYEISISCNQSITGNTEAISTFIQLRADLQKQLPANKVVLNLVVDNLDNVIKRIE